MELSELWGYKVIPQSVWSYREYRVISPGVIGVIDTELLELWGYKVIPQGGWSYREYRVIPPGVIGVIDVELSELWGYKVIHPGVCMYGVQYLHSSKMERYPS